MNKQLRSYDELLAYQGQLKELLVAQKQLIRYDIEEIKAELRPLTNVARFASKFFTRSKDHSLLVKTASSLIDLAVRKIIVPRFGWIGRAIIPFLARNISSHLVAGSKDGLLDTAISFLNHKKAKRST